MVREKPLVTYLNQKNPRHGPWENDYAFLDGSFNALRCGLCKKEGRTLFGKHILSPNTCNATAAFMYGHCKYVKQGDIDVTLSPDPNKIKITLDDTILPPVIAEPLLEKATENTS